MDDDLDLLRDPAGDGPPTRRPWRLLAAALGLTLVAVSGLVWAVGSMIGGDGDIRPAAASPTATTATTPAPATATATARPPVPAGTVATAATTPSRPIPTIRVPLWPSPTPAPTTRRPTLPPPSPTPQLVRVPDVTGLRLLSAILTLRAAGFAVSVAGSVGPAPEPDERRVSSQRPSGGSLAPKGSTVVLVLDST